MSSYLAHSGGNGVPPQPYEAHIRQVCQRAVEAARAAEAYTHGPDHILQDVVRAAGTYHDLGKLFGENQAALAGQRRERHLPLNHVDAGTALLLAQDAPLPALTVYAHHRGLPDVQAEFSREDLAFRDRDPALRGKTDRELEGLTALHHRLVGDGPPAVTDAPTEGLSLFWRMALSCLAEGDHGDTAAQAPKALREPDWPELRPTERLEALDRYVAGLGKADPRSALRDELYQACRTAQADEGFVFCDAPVGSGKTTALMAYLLHLAARKGLRRIFVVLPFTNLITQSVEVYRKALTLPGEDPKLVVSELHHRAEFEDISLRKLTALWRAPIVVTTAVAFFETLAANRPATLRRLHGLPGSAIFLDEAHTALPLKLIPLAWRWMGELASHWSCHWLLASGSLVRFWNIPALMKEGEQTQVPSLLPDGLRTRLLEYEKHRVDVRRDPEPKGREALICWVMDQPGPRLLIVNTVRTAAVLARDVAKRYGRNKVEHLSTALAPEDRAAVLDRVARRLADPLDTDWVLVATSCVEAGMDFSFRTGFRECASLLSLLQAAGRIDRDGRYGDGTIWSFTLQDDRMLRSNPGLATSADILRRYFSGEWVITPELSTQSILQQLREDTRIGQTIQYLFQQEDALQFATVAEKFVVIEADTVTVIVDPALIQSLQSGQVDWQQLQRRSVSIRREYIKPYQMRELGGGLYAWTRPYNRFLGYMAGVIPDETSKAYINEASGS